MVRKMTIGFETLITFWEGTYIRLLASMYPQVDFKITLLIEGFLTDSTDVGFFSCLKLRKKLHGYECGSLTGIC
jgi:hypothetical protein